MLAVGAPEIDTVAVVAVIARVGFGWRVPSSALDARTWSPGGCLVGLWILARRATHYGHGAAHWRTGARPTGIRGEAAPCRLRLDKLFAERLWGRGMVSLTTAACRPCRAEKPARQGLSEALPPVGLRRPGWARDVCDVRMRCGVSSAMAGPDGPPVARRVTRNVMEPTTRHRLVCCRCGGNKDGAKQH